MIAEDVPPANGPAADGRHRAGGNRMRRQELLRRLPWSAVPAPEPADFTGRALLLASEGRVFPAAAIDLLCSLAGPAGTSVHVLSIARIWGSRFGMPHPGLMPNKRELEVQRDLVREAVLRLRAQGYQAEGQVVSSRNPAKRISAAAAQRQSAAVIMAADARRHWLVADFLWSQEPYRVRRLAPVPVYLAVAAEG